MNEPILGRRVISSAALLLAISFLPAGAVTQIALAYGAGSQAVAAIAGAATLCLTLLALRKPLLALAARGVPEDPPANLDLPRTAASLILAAILVLAIASRLYTLLDRPVWDDEMWTLRNMYTSDWGELLRVAFDDYWPPLHYLLLNAITRIGDTGVFWLRIPSVVAGIATVALMYPLGLLLFRSRALALVGTVLLAGMTSHVLYSQEARVYALLILLAVASAYYFYRSYWERRVSLGFVAFTTLLLYSHSFASCYFIAGQWAYIILGWLTRRDRTATARSILSQAIVFVLWMPLISAFAYARVSRSIPVPTQWPTGMDRTPSILDVLELYQGVAVRSWTGAAFMALFVALALARAWASGALQRRRKATVTEAPATLADAVLYLACWAGLPVLASLAVSVVTPMETFGPIRYHMTVLPAVCLLAAAGFEVLRSSRELLLAGSLCILLPLAELPRYYRGFTHDAMDEAASIVRAFGTLQEPIYVGNGFRAFAYYFKGVFPRMGSERWDSLALAHAHLTERHTLDSNKWGDTYAYEKLSPRITHYSDNQVREAIRLAVEQGDFRPPFWMVQRTNLAEEIMQALRDHGVVCSRLTTYRVTGLLVRHCDREAAGS